MFTGCRTVPVSGRQQVNFFSESELDTAAATEFGKIKTQQASDPEKLASLKRVGQRIVEQARKEDASLPVFEQWEFVVIQDDTANAFAMPGGKVAFNTGIFSLFQSDDEIAVVMSHEVSHVIGRHGNERASHQALAQGGAVIADLAMQNQSQTLQTLVGTAYGYTTQYGAILPFSRKHESEADEIGLRIMAKAGYNPQAAVTFWKRMSEKSSGSTMEFLSTHPSDSTRIANLQKLMPVVMADYEQAMAKNP
jgi:predicted Zn-dependent protease